MIPTDGGVSTEFVAESVPRHGDHERHQLLHRLDLWPATRDPGEKAAENDLADIEGIDKTAESAVNQSGSYDTP
jgi:hypothetical protein